MHTLAGVDSVGHIGTQAHLARAGVVEVVVGTGVGHYVHGRTVAAGG